MNVQNPGGYSEWRKRVSVEKTAALMEKKPEVRQIWSLVSRGAFWGKKSVYDEKKMIVNEFENLELINWTKAQAKEILLNPIFKW